MSTKSSVVLKGADCILFNAQQLQNVKVLVVVVVVVVSSSSSGYIVSLEASPPDDCTSLVYVRNLVVQ